MITAKNIVLLILMLLSAALAAVLRPTISLADERPPIDLAAMVPSAFGDWREEVNLVGQVVNPQQQTMLDKIYSQTLSRTYINSKGYRMMLSIAYGRNQSDALSLHKPEICYPAQGFTLLTTEKDQISLMGHSMATTRLTTELGQRFEPITYWTVVGDDVVASGIHKKWTEMLYAMRNRVPDGMLVRVSSVDKNTEVAHAIQSQFVNDMVGSVSTAYRGRFAGITRSP